MTATRDLHRDPFEEVLRGALRQDADVAVPDRLRWAVAREIEAPTARARGRWSPPARVDTWLRIGAAAAGAFVVAIFGGWLLLSQPGPDQDDAVLPAASEPVPSVRPSPPATTAPTPTAATPTEAPETVAVADPRIAGDGPWLMFEPGPGSLDRTDPAFDEEVLRREAFPDHPDVTAVATDGQVTVGVIEGHPDQWTKLEPMRIFVRGPDGEVIERSIDVMHEVIDLAVGPAGIVLITDPGTDPGDQVSIAAHVTRRSVPPDQGSVVVPVGACGGRYKDGSVFRLPGCMKIVARFGYRPSDFVGEEHTYAWFSADGRRWRRLPYIPNFGRGAIVATDDGFVASGEDGRRILASTDGLHWQRVEGAPGGELHPWRGDALLIGSREIGLVDAAGYRKLPGLSGVIGRDKPIDPVSGKHRSRVFVGDIGLVYMSLSDGVVLYSPDLEQWSLTPIPDEWRTDCRTKRTCRAPFLGSDTDELALLAWTTDPDAPPEDTLDSPVWATPQEWHASVVSPQRVEGQP